MFHKGDRVVVQFPEDLPDTVLESYSPFFKEGESGTVLLDSYSDGLTAVVFDDYSTHRHDFGIDKGGCKQGYGAWVNESYLVLEEPWQDYGPIDLSKILEVK